MVEQVGDVVAICDFESAMSGVGLSTGCPGIEFSQAGDFTFDVASASNSPDTGPTADHTSGGGKCHNGSSGSRSVKKKKTCARGSDVIGTFDWALGTPPNVTAKNGALNCVYCTVCCLD